MLPLAGIIAEMDWILCSTWSYKRSRYIAAFRFKGGGFHVEFVSAVVWSFLLLFYAAQNQKRCCMISIFPLTVTCLTRHTSNNNNIASEESCIAAVTGQNRTEYGITVGWLDVEMSV